MAATYPDPTIDEYLRKRLMPVEDAIPHLPGIEMYGNSIPAGTVGGVSSPSILTLITVVLLEAKVEPKHRQR